MRVVVDASVMITANRVGPAAERARNEIADNSLVAPHSLGVEVVQGFRRLVSSGECSERHRAAVRIPGALNPPSCAGAKSRWAPPKRGPSLRAERVGFEPTGGVTRHLLSREARSAGLWHLSICRVATYRANPCDFEWRKEGDSNPRRLSPRRFSRPLHSSALPPFRPRQ